MITNHDCARFEIYTWNKQKERGFPEGYPERWQAEPTLVCEYGHNMSVPQILMSKEGEPVCLTSGCDGSLCYNQLLPKYKNMPSWPDMDKAVQEYWDNKCRTS